MGHLTKRRTSTYTSTYDGDQIRVSSCVFISLFCFVSQDLAMHGHFKFDEEITKVPAPKPKTIKPSSLQTKLSERHKQLAEADVLERSGKMVIKTLYCATTVGYKH